MKNTWKNTWPLPYNEIKLTGKKQLAFMLEKRMVASQDVAVKKSILRKLLKINLSVCLLLITCNLFAQPSNIVRNGVEVKLNWQNATNGNTPPLVSVTVTTNTNPDDVSIFTNGKWVFFIWWNPGCKYGAIEYSNAKDLPNWKNLIYTHTGNTNTPHYQQYFIPWRTNNMYFRLRKLDNHI